MADADIQKVCVVGAGNMGHQISICAALAGYDVACTDIDAGTLKRAEEFADTWLPSRVTKGKMTEEVAAQTRARLAFVPSLTAAAADADLVFESIVERLDAKRELFRELDSLCRDHTILATNSGYIVSSQLAEVTSRPERVVNTHFFNPALVMKLVEVVKGPHVSDETAGIVMEVIRRMGKVPVLVNKEIYGFVVNRIVEALLKEALYLYDMGVASCEDIDLAVVNGLGHPMGPFHLLDLTGIDLYYTARMERYRQTGDDADRMSPAAVEKYVKGKYGKKVGQGFFTYEK